MFSALFQPVEVESSQKEPITAPEPASLRSSEVDALTSPELPKESVTPVNPPEPVITTTTSAVTTDTPTNTPAHQPQEKRKLVRSVLTSS